jgi:hypothetical protein
LFRGAVSTFILTTCAQQGPTFTASLSQPRSQLAATSVGNLALFAGGFAESIYSDRVDIYNSLDDTWTTANLSQPRRILAATTVGQLALFGGGNEYGDAHPQTRVDLFLLCTEECSPIDCFNITCQNSLCATTFKPTNSSCDDGFVCNGDEVCDGVGNCIPSITPAPLNTSCDDGIWCDGDDVCDGNGTCVDTQPRCDSNLECNSQCNEMQQNCFSDAGALCQEGICTGCIIVHQQND